MLTVLCLLAACKGKDKLPASAEAGGTGSPVCASGGGETVDPSMEPAPNVTCPPKDAPVLCVGQWAAHCTNGKLGEMTNCRAANKVCLPGKCAGGKCGGCAVCVPDSTKCGQNGERLTCNQAGSAFESSETCDEAGGKRCSLTLGACADLCAAAAQDGSYIGCEYWAVPTANTQLLYEMTDADGLCQPFPFAVIIANTEGVPANVRIDSGDGTTRSVRVDPSQSTTVKLPCSLPLKGDPKTDLASIQLQGAAHHIVSDIPVTVYQFNPLEYQGTSKDGRHAYSYTNDASLLLPVHSLTGNYRVISHPTLQQQVVFTDKSLPTKLDSLSGFVDILGVEATPTDVEIISTAHTRPSSDGRIPALAPGDTLKVTLAQGEVLQLATDAPSTCAGSDTEPTGIGKLTYCQVGNDYDLTGTQIRASGRVSVISGNDCTFVPYNRWACDHLEETMFPVESWGREIFMTISAQADCAPDLPNVFRVLSSSDDNSVRFTPPVHEPVTLQRGGYVELESDKPFEVSATKAILVAQYMVGQDYANPGGQITSLAKGDPSLSLGVPMEQWRTRYSFLTPSTYTDNLVNVVARQDQIVTLDGLLVSGYTPIESTSMGIARVKVEPGSHIIESDASFQIILYGYAPYTSYMLPGGLDLRAINSPE